jgi:hypothetical protein
MPSGLRADAACDFLVGAGVEEASGSERMLRTSAAEADRDIVVSHVTQPTDHSHDDVYWLRLLLDLHHRQRMDSGSDYAEENDFVDVRIPVQGKGPKDCSPSKVEDDPFYSKWLGNGACQDRWKRPSDLPLPQPPQSTALLSFSGKRALDSWNEMRRRPPFRAELMSFESYTQTIRSS